MPVPTDITAGTLTLTNGSTAVTGTGTAWLASSLRQGDVIIWAEGADGFQMPILADVPSSQTALTLVNPWPGPTLTDVPYRIRFQWDSSRVSGQIRQLTDRLDSGNIVAFSALEGPGVPVFDGPHSMVIRSLNEFISGVTVDARVQTLAERAAYDAQAANFSVYVNDIGDGRAAVYFKLSATSGDWSTPAYQTGPVGPAPNVEATVTSIASDQTATVTETPITGGVRLDFSLPRSDGFRNLGAYNSANSYVKDDVVSSNGSTFIALQAVPAGTTPSGANPPVSTAFWQVLAQRGTNGTGTGDVVGPNGAVNNRLAAYDGTSGKLIKDGGKLIDDVVTGPASATANRLMVSNGTSGKIIKEASGLSGAEQTQARTDIAAVGISDTQTISGAKTFSATTTFSGLVNLTGGQIAFPATQIPSSDPNTFDDYEEGTYTPTYANIAVGNGVVDARYVKKGRSCDTYFGITLGSTSSLNAAAITIGLPFAGAVSHGFAYAIDTGTASHTGVAVAGASTVTFTGNNVAFNWFNAQPFTWAATDQLRFNINHTTTN